MTIPDFTFSPGSDPPLDQLQPLFAHVLGPAKTRPTVSLGAITRAKAEAWLTAQHLRYSVAVGEKRSTLVWNMKILERVDLVGLADG